MMLSRLTSVSLAAALLAFGASANADTVTIAIAGPFVNLILAAASGAAILVLFPQARLWSQPFVNRADGHQGVVGYPAYAHPFVAIGRPAAHGGELLAREPLQRSFMGGAVNAHIGHLAAPALEPAIEFLP